MAKPLRLARERHADPMLEALRKVTLYASALRRVVCDEGHGSMLGLARAVADIGDPVDALDDAIALLAERGVDCDGR